PTFILQSVDFSMVSSISWKSIFSQSSYLLTIASIIIILMLLNVSGLETIIKQKTDLDKELKLTGLANMISALFVGFPGIISLPGTALNKKSGANNRISGFVASIVCLCV